MRNVLRSRRTVAMSDVILPQINTVLGNFLETKTHLYKNVADPGKSGRKGTSLSRDGRKGLGVKEFIRTVNEKRARRYLSHATLCELL